MDKKRLADLFKLVNWEYGRCFAVPEDCRRPPIRAHSVQNAQALELLARNGHVVGMTRRMDAKQGPVIEFGEVGRNRATTFAGLCSEHDQTVFAPLDRAPFDTKNPEHLFLAAYRATFYELHATCAAASMLQTGYVQRVAAGLDPRDTPSPAGILAMQNMIKAYETFMHKREWDEAYLTRDFACMRHDVIEITVAQPTIAASSLFTVGEVYRKGAMVRACLNILPMSATQSVAVFSYLRAEAAAARRVLKRVLSSRGQRQKYELSRRLLNSCENFVIAPAYFATWSDDKKQVVREYFTRTILQEDLVYEHPDLFLF